MLSRNQRIPTTLFRRVASSSYTISTPLFLCRWKPSDITPSRFGVVISSKVCKKAVDRNSFRRQTQEAIRQYIPLDSKNINAIFFSKKPLVQASYAMISQDIRTTLHRIQKITTNSSC